MADTRKPKKPTPGESAMKPSDAGPATGSASPPSASPPSASPPSAAPSGPGGVRRFDRPGHLDPKHVRSLLALGGGAHRRDEDRAFVEGERTHDDLAEELAEEAVLSMTSGEDALSEALDAYVDEDRGGPFIETPAGREFADGTDPSNPEDATREPFPTT